MRNGFFIPVVAAPKRCASAIKQLNYEMKEYAGKVTKAATKVKSSRWLRRAAPPKALPEGGISDIETGKMSRASYT